MHDDHSERTLQMQAKMEAYWPPRSGNYNSWLKRNVLLNIRDVVFWIGIILVFLPGVWLVVYGAYVFPTALSSFLQSLVRNQIEEKEKVQPDSQTVQGRLL